MSFIQKITRRNFIKKAIVSVVTLEFVYLFVNLLKKGPEAKGVVPLYDAGEIENFEKGKTYPFSAGHFYLSRLKDGGFLAISTKCTHLGCTVQFKNKDKKFLCPCHASAFSEKGEVLSPPATRALDIYPITIKNGKLMVDTSNPTKRDKYKRSQIAYV